MKKILLLCVTSQNVITFRARLIKALQEKGYAISVVAFDNEYKEDIAKLKVDFYCIEEKNRSMNPLKILSLKGKYKKLIKQINPDIVFTFMLKPNTFGVLAAKSAGVKNIYSMVEGAGDAFIHNSLKWKIVRSVICALYRKAFKYSKKIFFLNTDDKTEFIQRNLVTADQCEIVHGIGVDLEKFSFKPLQNTKTFLMVARMLETKGVYEYCKCARLVKQKYPDAVFNYLGAEGTVKLSDIQEYIDDGSIHYLGTTKDVRSYLEECSVYVLPSYREGASVSIMEAQATGRAVITTQTIGCRNMIDEGENGFLVPVGNSGKLAEKMLWFLENLKAVEKMGVASRKFAENNYDPKLINEKIVNVIENK